MGIALVGSGKHPSPKLTDIPAMLRSAASRMEAGIDETPETFIWVTSYDDASINVGAFGENPSKAEVVGMLILASHKFDADEGDVTRG